MTSTTCRLTPIADAPPPGRGRSCRRRLRLEHGKPRVDRRLLLRRELSGVGFELTHAALHHEIGRGRHRDLLQQPSDHVGRNRIGRIREQRNRRPAAKSGSTERLTQPAWDHDSDRDIAAAHQPLGAGTVERRCGLLFLGGGPDSQAAFLPQARRRRGGSVRIDLRRPRQRGSASSPGCPGVPKTVAKIEKKMIGRRNVSACATRSRVRLVAAIRISVSITLSAPFRSGG